MTPVWLIPNMFDAFGMVSGPTPLGDAVLQNIPSWLWSDSTLIEDAVDPFASLDATVVYPIAVATLLPSCTLPLRPMPVSFEDTQPPLTALDVGPLHPIMDSYWLPSAPPWMQPVLTPVNMRDPAASANCSLASPIPFATLVGEGQLHSKPWIFDLGFEPYDNVAKTLMPSSPLDNAPAQDHSDFMLIF